MILRRFFHRYFNGWQLLFVVLFLFLVFPIGYIVGHLFESGSDGWQHIVDTLLVDYTINSLILVVVVSVIAFLFGVPAAWFIVTCDFPLRKHFEWALMMPLAIPSYIIAFTYAEMCSHTGSIQKIYAWITGGANLPFDIMTMPGVALMMASVLFPYTYIISRSSFLTQSQSLIEASRLMGKSNLYTFLNVVLPLARPAIFGSLFLIMMDVLNEYGAMKFYGVSTFTTGIFKAWLSLGDANAAIRLAACLLLFVLALILLEKWQRGNASYTESAKSSKPLQRVKLSGWSQLWAVLACLIPLAIGFIIPFTQLAVWMFQTAQDVIDEKFLGLIINSVKVAGISAILVLLVSIIMVYAVRLNSSRWMRHLSKVATLGYAIPGAVIAVGIMASFLNFDKLLNSFAKAYLDTSFGLIFSGSLIALVFAYLIRFLAVSFNPVETGFEKVAGNLDEASRSLGASPLKTLFRINLPILRPALLSAIIMVFVEVMKELPLTLILRPFNFDTLATKAYEMASDELIANASNASVLVILIGMIPVIMLVRLMGKGR